jgi:succinate-acetate transporter protein
VTEILAYVRGPATITMATVSAHDVPAPEPMKRRTAPAPVTNTINPAPLGFISFGLTTFVLSVYNAGIWGIQVNSPPNVVIGLTVFYGGLAQFIAGQWSFAAGNALTATAFSSYGAFYLALSALYIPWFGVIDAYETAPAHTKNIDPAVGIFLLAWAMFTFFMWFGTFKSNIAFCLLFFFLTLTFVLLSISEFKRSNLTGNRVKRAGGFFGIFTALIAWYIGLARLLTPEISYITLPLGDLGRKHLDLE